MIKLTKKWWGSSTSKTDSDIECLDKIQLIEGTFNPIEAADVLLSLVTYKIKFHNLQLLNLDANHEAARKQSERRIAELKEAKNKITQIIMEARNSGASLEITSDIEIRIKNSK